MDQHLHIINEFNFDNDQEDISYLSSPFMDDKVVMESTGPY
ncbi:MAG: hypothetical protein QXI38_04415 [Conexivisphaerales archaeon]